MSIVRFLGDRGEHIEFDADDFEIVKLFLVDDDNGNGLTTIRWLERQGWPFMKAASCVYWAQRELQRIK